MSWRGLITLSVVLTVLAPLIGVHAWWVDTSIMGGWWLFVIWLRWDLERM